MLDPKLLRESPELVRSAIATKHLSVDRDAVQQLDQSWRSLLTQVESLRAQQKSVNGEMAQLTKGSPEFLAKVGEMKSLKTEVKTQEAALKEAEAAWETAMMSLPNLPHESVPEGKVDEDNVVAATHGEVGSVSAQAKPHWEIDGFEKLFDFPRGAKVTGAGFPYYIGDGAKLVRALIHFFLDEAGQAGYTEVNPPIFVHAASATASGNLPDNVGHMYETVVDQLYAVRTA